MKDFISKVTFGFLMAQLLPGLVVMSSLSCLILNDNSICNDFSALIDKVGKFWFDTPARSIAFIFLSISTGMLIHGLNWTVLAWIENRAGVKGCKSVRGDFLWHKWYLFGQVLFSPIAILIEVLWLLGSKSLMPLIMDENIARVREDKMAQFTFLQEFYLHFGQFYAHIAYALWVSMICCFLSLFSIRSMKLLGIGIMLYFVTSIFFLLGRIQLGTLFNAENNLIEDGSKENHVLETENRDSHL